MTSPQYQPSIEWDARVRRYLEGALGPAKFAAITAALALPPRTTCLRVSTLRATVHEVHQHILKSTASTASQCQAKPWGPDTTAGQGPLPVDYSCATGEVMVSRKTAEAVLRGAPIYAPGVLACSSGVCSGDLVAVTIALEPHGSSHCGVSRGLTLRPGDAAQAAALPNREHLHIGVGRAAMSRAEMFRAESGVAVRMEHPVYRVPSAAGLEGKVMFQNLPSVVAAMALRPAPGARVLDMCAAPGGKTTMLAQLMGNQGTVIALDRTHAKVAQVMSLAAELGCTCVQAYRMDASKAVLSTEGLLATREATPEASVTDNGQQAGQGKVAAREARRRAARAARGLAAMEPPGSDATAACPIGFPPESFDYVLLDAPCSALGLRPRLVQPATLEYLWQCGSYNRKLLDAAVQLLRPGGRMVFSTCTISPRENESSVRWLLDKYGDEIKLVQAEPYVGGPGLVGRHPGMGGNPGNQEVQNDVCGSRQRLWTECGGDDDCEVWLTPEEAHQVQRFDPSGGQDDTIGFFIAAFEKVPLDNTVPCAS